MGTRKDGDENGNSLYFTYPTHRLTSKFFSVSNCTWNGPFILITSVRVTTAPPPSRAHKRLQAGAALPRPRQANCPVLLGSLHDVLPSEAGSGAACAKDCGQGAEASG